MSQQQPYFDKSDRTEAELHPEQVAGDIMKPHKKELERTLRKLGADKYDLTVPETHMLPRVIQPNEEIMGVVYGRYVRDEPAGKKIIGRGLLVATDKRVLLIDRKPVFIKNNEIAYKVVSAVTYSKVAFIGTVTLHTRLGNINVRTFNDACATGFVRAIEKQLFSERGVANDQAN
ncbi:MAG TPA: PH domain-containing protein [Candidatus Saccharimonadales bacterium]